MSLTLTKDGTKRRVGGAVLAAALALGGTVVAQVAVATPAQAAVCGSTTLRSG